MSEHDEQLTIFEYCYGLGGNVEPRLRMLHVIANGAWKGAGRMEAGMSESAGVPDLMLPVAIAPFHGLYLELKVKGGKVSAKQRAWQKRLRAEGYASEICYGADRAIEALLQYLTGTLPPF